MIKYGFTINECDKCVYIKTVGDACIIVCLYVDDMLILGTNIEVIKSTKRMLSKNFDMKNLRVADVILRIKITRTPNGISLSQSHCGKDDRKIQGVWDKRKYKSVSSTHPPSQEYRNWSMTVGVFSNYRKSNVFNELHWPDIAFAVSKFSRYTSNPSDDHCTRLLWVLGYASHTKEYALRYGQYPPILEGYGDANWIADSEE